MQFDIEVLKNFITWSFVMVGWYIVAHQNKSRDRRGEIRAMVEKAQDIATSLADKGREYWTEDETHENARQLAYEIKLGLAQLSRIVNVLFRHNRKISCLTALKDYRRALTAGDFESLERTATALSDPHLLAIATGAILVSDALEDGYEAVYCL